MSDINATKNAVIIGETNFSIACAEMLLAHSWHIISFTSSDLLVLDWCGKNSILSLTLDELYKVTGKEFYLFSIINSHIIPITFLQKNKVTLAINYHDSLLPMYAGLNSTTWAILFAEEYHGVTWHTITSKIDGGDIIGQAKIKIESDDTVQSLNIKCTEQGYNLFKQIINKLGSRSHISNLFPQSNKNKSYFGAGAIPDNYAIVYNFTPIQYIERLFRSLSFGGSYYNPVASVKCFINNEVYLLPSNCIAKGSANNIVLIDDKNNILKIKNIKDAYGNDCALDISEPLLIQRVVLDEKEKKQLSQIKAKENMVKLCLTNLDKYNMSLIMFPNIVQNSTNKVKNYVMVLEHNKVKNIAAGISLVLLKLTSTTKLLTTIYHDVHLLSPNMKKLVDYKAFILLDETHLTLKFDKFIDFWQSELDNGYLLTKDYGYRYNLNLCTQIALVMGKACNIDKGHRLVIEVTDSSIIIRGYSEDSVIINKLYDDLNLLSLDLIKTFKVDEINFTQQISNLTDKFCFPSNIVHTLEKQINLTPYHVALISDYEQLTYDQLNIRSNQFAHYLTELGVGRNDFVGISLERGVHLVIVIIGILKSGGAYLPIDPEYPEERIQFILSDAEVKFMVSEESIINKIQFNCKHLIDFNNFKFDRYSPDNCNVATQKEDLAYMIYTSGTTGKPKGVMISHGNLCGRLLGLLDVYKVDENWIHLHYSSYSFDASVEEIFLALLAGGKVVIAPKEAGKNPSILIEAIDKHKITAINFVPSVLQLFLNTLKISFNEEYCRTLQCVISGGEVLSTSLVRKFYEMINAKLYNTYGPTENTIDSTYYLCNQDENGASIPIGKPVPNSTAYVLNKNLQPVAAGENGELYVGGVGVALGYHKRSDLTKEKFIPNPFNLIADPVLYKSGDIVRLNNNGDLEFIGRIDQQVKIRGLRIELGEIYNILIEFNLIKDIVVHVREDNVSNKVIIAYIVKIEEHIADEDVVYKIKEYAKNKLPRYMIPVFIIIEQVPLTTNGKIDYDTLTKLTYSGSNTECVVVTELQQLIINMYQEILGVEQIGINDDFFALGGHSLMAIKLISNINEYFTTTFSVRILFEYPIVFDLSNYIEDKLGIKNSLQYEKHSITKMPQGVVPTASFEQQSLWFIQQFAPISNAYNISAVYELKGSVDYNVLNESYKIILNRHDILRTNFVANNDCVIQIIHENSQNDLLFVDLQDIKPSEVLDTVAKYELNLTNLPYDLEHDFLIRMHLLKFSDNLYYLFINVHHIIFDGLSMVILLKELSYNYAQLVNNKQINVPKPEIQFADFVYFTRQWLNCDSAKKQLAFWRNMFVDTPPLLILPYDYPRPKVLTFAGNTIEFVVEQPLNYKLYKLAKHCNGSIFSVLTSAFFILLYRYTLQDDITIGTVIANRDCREIEDLIGFFVNVIPLRYKINSEQSFIEVQDSLHNNILDIFSNKDIPFEMLVNELAIPRDSSYNPLFQVAFTFEDTSVEKLQLNSIDTKIIPIKHNWAKYDLSLNVDAKEELLHGKFEFNTALFNSSTIEAIIAHFLKLLESIVDNPNTAISRLSLLTANDLEYISKYNNTNYNFPQKEFLLHELFEYSALNNPAQLAIITPTIEITYATLDNCAKIIASRILAHGVQPGELVAVIMEKGWEQIVAILGILKASAVYLPINIDEPDDRINNILAKSYAKTIIVQERLVIHQQRWKYINIVTISEEILSHPVVGNVTFPKTNKNKLAYVIFTSGSTGEPKGVMINHEGAVNTILDINKRFLVTPQDKILAISNLTFDLSVYDVFGALAAGATIVLPKHIDNKEPAAWLSLICKHKITIWNSVPALIQMLLYYVEGMNTLNSKTSLNNTIRLVLMSGDWIMLDLPNKIKNIFGDKVQSISLGGATEASIWSVLYNVEKLDLSWRSIPYGAPMLNQNMYVLDANLNDLPVGVVGEIFIGGIGLAMGYFSDIEKTQSSFINSHNGKPLYKTGDLGRYHKNGYIEFLGRKDNQVKINGYRIELGEIRYQLVNNEEISDAIVRMDKQFSNIRLLAYVVMKKESLLNENKIVHYLNSKLPSYMIPHKIIFIEEIPLTANGKIDYNFLPKPDLNLNETMKICLETETEKQLAEVWSGLLNTTITTNSSNFFVVGGNSLLAVRLSIEIQSIFNVELMVKSIFEYPHLYQMAQTIDVLIWSQNKNFMLNEDIQETGTI